MTRKKLKRFSSITDAVREVNGECIKNKLYLLKIKNKLYWLKIIKVNYHSISIIRIVSEKRYGNLDSLRYRYEKAFK